VPAAAGTDTAAAADTVADTGTGRGAAAAVLWQMFAASGSALVRASALLLVPS